MSLKGMQVFRGSGFSPFSEEVPPGTYPGKIVSVTSGTRPVYQKPDQTEPAIVITIKFSGTSGQAVTYEEKLKPSANANSTLRKRVEAVFLDRCTPDVMGNDDKYLALVEELQGQHVTLVIGTKPAKKDPSKRYSTLDTILPLKNPPAQVQEFKPGQDFTNYPDKVDTSGTSFDEDDLPF